MSVFLVAIATLLVWPALVSAQTSGVAPPRVLLLMANDHRIPVTLQMTEAARVRLTERLGDVRFYSDFLDLQRFPSDADQDRTARFLSDKYASIHLDVIIAIGPQALRFITDRWPNGASPSKVVYCAVGSDLAEELASRPNIVGGTAAEFDYVKTLTMARALQPKAHKVVAIFGSSNFDREQNKRVREQLASEEKQIEIEYWSGRPLADVLRQVAELPPDTIVLPAAFRGDVSGKVMIPWVPLSQIMAAASAPTYSVYDTQVGQGVVGGYSMSFADEGRVAADLAADVIEGRELGRLPVRRPVQNKFRVDAQQLDRWGFSRANLPPDTLVMFEKPTLWSQYRLFVLVTLGVIVVQSALVTTLLIQRQRRVRAEAEAEQRRQEVAHLMRVSILGELSGALAHEITQPLTAILSNAHAALDMLPEHAPGAVELREAIEDIVQEDTRAGEVVKRLRRLLKKGDKTNEPFDMNELVLATVTLLRSEGLGRGITIKTELADALPRVWGDPIQIQQVLLNLAMNAMDAMASTPSTERIVLFSTAITPTGGIDVLVRDRGVGLPTGDKDQVFKPFFTTKDRGLGLGLAICSSIAQAHDGKVTLISDEDGGAVATLSLPASKQVPLANDTATLESALRPLAANP